MKLLLFSLLYIQNMCLIDAIKMLQSHSQNWLFWKDNFRGVESIFLLADAEQCRPTCLRFSLSGVGISQPIKHHLLLECYKANNNKVLDSSYFFLFICRSCTTQSKYMDLYQCISAGILWLEGPWNNSGACTLHDHWSLYLTWADQEILFI